ncbi:MAG: TatD family hydrolase [Armatimonadota bacterium]
MNQTGLIDAHLHLQDYEPGTDIQSVISQSKANGVTHFVCNGTEEDDWHIVRGYAKTFPGVIPCYGLHPWFVPSSSPEWIHILEEYISSNLCGVGEIGLDRNREPFDNNQQEEVFIAQLGLARKYNRPTMIHCVKSWGWMMDILQREESLPAGMLIHAYGGSVDLIKPLMKMGAYFSFSGKVLFSNYERARKALKAVPLDRLLIESDAPNMIPPDEYRTFTIQFSDGDEYNHPGSLPAIMMGISGLLDISPETLKDILWENSLRFFKPILSKEI